MGVVYKRTLVSHRTADTIYELDGMEREQEGGEASTPPPEKDDNSEGWERIIDRSHFHVLRKPVPDSNLYEYKGTVQFYCREFLCNRGSSLWNGKNGELGC